MLKSNLKKIADKCLLKGSDTKWYSNLYHIPELMFLPFNRRVESISKSNVKRLYQSIKEFGIVFVPIQVTIDGYIIDGQHRYNILKKLAEEGVEVIYHIETVPFSSKDIDRKAVQAIQYKNVWNPEDKLESIAKDFENPDRAAFAQYLIDLARREFCSVRGVFGVRNALVLASLNPNTFEENLPEFSPSTVEAIEQLYREIVELLTVAKQQEPRLSYNNWVEAFIKVWVAIRTGNDRKLKVDGNNFEVPITASALNEMIGKIGISALASNWVCYAGEALGGTSVSAWGNIIVKAIFCTYNTMSKYHIALSK